MAKKQWSNPTPIQKIPSPLPRPPVQIKWIEELSPWLQNLAQLHQSDLQKMGIQFLSAKESQTQKTSIQEQHQQSPFGTFHTQATLEYSQEQFLQYIPIAKGPILSNRQGVEESMIWWINAQKPTQLFLAFSERYPPFLWVPAGITLDSIKQALLPVYPHPQHNRLTLSKQQRGFGGYFEQMLVPNPYSGELEAADPLDLGRHFYINSFVEPYSWGSAYPDDPWPDQIPAQAGFVIKMIAQQQKVQAQTPGGIWSCSFRTRHSRSYLSIQVYHDILCVFQVRYAHQSYQPIIQNVNQRFGSSFPLDFPLDVIGALLGFHFETSESIEQDLEKEEEPDQIRAMLLLISALRYDDPAVLPLFRSYAKHANLAVRGAVGNIALDFNWVGFLEEMCLHESTYELKAQLENILDRGAISPPAWSLEEVEEEDSLDTDDDFEDKNE